MLCYIKDFKTFETIDKFDTSDYTIADGESGEVVIYQKNAIELTTKYAGMWLVINRELVYISEATPENDLIRLTVQSPIYAFTRPVEYTGETTYGEAITNILNNNYGLSCPDPEYRLSYLSVSNTDTTTCNIETDEFGFVVPYEVFDDALYYGVSLDFEFTNTTLLVNVYTNTESEGVIVFNDGSTVLESESYGPNYLAKVTVRHRLPSDPESENPDETFELIDYYLSADNQISTTPPVNRAKGIWQIYDAGTDEEPILVALSAFSHNNENHKIEFRSLKRFNLYQRIRMRLRSSVFETLITARIKSSADDRYLYKCGNLSTTLTEKVDEEAESTNSEIKTIKKRLASMSSSMIADVIFAMNEGTQTFTIGAGGSVNVINSDYVTAPDIPDGYERLCYGARVAGDAACVSVAINNYWIFNGKTSTSRSLTAQAWAIFIRKY